MRDLIWVAIGGLLLTVAVFMAAADLAAALGPERRALRGYRVQDPRILPPTLHVWREQLQTCH